MLVKFRDLSSISNPDYTPAVMRFSSTGGYAVGGAVPDPTTLRINRLFSYQAYGTASISNVRGAGWHYLRFNFDATTKDAKAKIWHIDDPEPGVWDLELNASGVAGDDSDNSGIGVHVYRGSNGAFHEWAWLSFSDNPAVPAENPDQPGGDSNLLASGATAGDTWAVECQSATTLSAGAVASDNLGAIAQVNMALVDAAQASDSTGDQPAAVGSLQSAATGNDTVDALASAAAALSAGAAAGESWTVQAQAVVNLLEQGVAADEMRRQTEGALTAAMAESSQAADQFVAAINALVSLTDGATATDTYLAVVAQLASIASGAVASDSFRTGVGQVRAISNGALTSDAWAVMVNLAAALSSTCTANDLMHARATMTASVRAGAVATDRFAIVNAGVRYLVMGAIILRDALQYRVTSKPALNQSVKIKPGH
ncbi:hypothetical protein ACJO2E_08610 [Marinobacter sp. M1N3S26]|uniref:hypothetical protein n=1 Tax=Marinobacter sp. M1N3S26 TaxID=3382299 RepID=UPI00387A9218